MLPKKKRGPGRGKRWTQVASMRRRGWTDKRIAAKLGISRERVRQIRTALELPRVPRPSEERACAGCSARFTVRPSSDRRCCSIACGKVVGHRAQVRWRHQQKEAPPSPRFRAIAADYATGMTWEALRLKHQCSKALIARALARCGVAVSGRGSWQSGKRVGQRDIVEARKARALELFRADRSYREIAEEIGVSIATARNYCLGRGGGQ